VRILKRIVGESGEVVVCFDADRAGQAAAQKAIDLLRKEDVQVRIARIPQGEDPDSLLRKQPVEVFETILREAKDYTRHLLEVACAEEDVASPRGRGAVAAKIPNAVQREGFLLDVARRLQVPRSVLEEEVRKAEQQIRRTELQQQQYPRALASSEEPADSAVAVEAEPQEPIQAAPLIEALISLLMTNPEIVPQVSRQLNPAWLEGLGGAEVVLQLLEAHAHDGFENAAQFLEECDDRMRNYLTGLLFEPPPLPAETTAEAYADRLVRNFEKRAQQERLQMLSLAAKSGELTVEERIKYGMEILAILREFPDLKPQG
jgi:DNA primase